MEDFVEFYGTVTAEGEMKKSNRMELKIVETMIKIYCEQKHRHVSLCEECSRLVDYARQRIERCYFNPDKPVCKGCPVHCYSPKMKEKIKEVMRFSGPRMIYKHPMMAIYHMMK